ncbi:DUF6443 domain-containing protein [Ferruginibacter yonginensis]|uniref:DUF6443 domain-containing protein n=1 Tax=Ferruginibacter yonginensis TaxID=1310416 RepID=A0ABV8QRR8_9BACT
MIQQLLQKFLGLYLVLCFFTLPTYGQIEEGIVMPNVFAVPAITGANLAVSGTTNTINYSNTGEVAAKILNVITFKIKEGQNNYIATSFTASVQVNVELTDMNSVVTTPPAITLNINYDKATGAKFVVRDYRTFEGYKSVKVTLASPITITGATSWDPKPLLEVENEMRITRYFNLSTNATDLTAAITTSQPTPDVLQLNWNFPADANFANLSAAHENMTQLEWTYVENELLPFYNNNFEALFQKNSTRVDLEYRNRLTGYLYKIPLLYPNEGKLFYRVRAVQQKANGTLITGPWSTVSATQNAFAFMGHEPNLNWQSSSSFAEEGKYKTVIQYFDGSLRGRQTVTKDNTTGNTVVGETIYDYQGRPNVQILPTPTIDNTIKYFNGFNKFVGMAVDDDPAKYFDLTPSALKCQASPKLDSAYGNGKYYSGNNSWLTTESKSKFIPNAQGYAYTETRFTDDATQRIKSQGGVGIDHQIGSGHETQYFYGKPSQAELDALFATEVGDASHYFKNMVRDANGQMSVSYVDMHGRTIATALAGDAPNGLDGIQNNADYPLAASVVKNDLLTSTTNIINGNQIESISTILAPAVTNYHFVYELNPAILSLLTCTNQPICFDCKYDLEISIRPEQCDNDAPIVKKYANLSMVPANAACTTPMGFIGENINTPTTQISFDYLLPAGSYVVRKTLTINDSLFKIRRAIALDSLLCRTQQQIYDSVYTVFSTTTGCGNTNPSQSACDSCNAHLGSFNTYAVKYLQSIAPATATMQEIQALYSMDSVECKRICGTGTNPAFATLVGYRNQMLADMEPFTGQYATDTIVTNNGVPNYQSLDAKFNIFTNSYINIVGGATVTPTNKPFYRNPLHETNTPANKYFTENNIVDETIHAPVSNGSTTTILENINKADFTAIFQPKWRESLIKYHPEYSKLHYAETALLSAYTWLDNVMATTTYASAVTNNYLNFTAVDPFFNMPGTALQKDTLNHYLNVGIAYNSSPINPSIWQMANGSILCNTTTGAARAACMEGTTTNGLSSLITSDADKNEVWESVKLGYLSYRNQMVVRYINSHATNALSEADMARLNVEGKQLIFALNENIAAQNGWSWWQGVTNANNFDTTGVGVSTANNTINFCKGQRPLWRAKLLQCDVLKNKLLLETPVDSAQVNSIIDQILDGMESVCNHSQTPQNPNGASTVNPIFVGTPRSFEEVINNVFANNNISTTPGDHYYCNPFTIDNPKPFGLNVPAVVNNSNVLDSCACRRFGQLQLEAAAAGYNPNTFASMNTFLNNVYRDSLTLVVWTGLQQCSGIFTDTCSKDKNVISKPSIKNTKLQSTKNTSGKGSDCVAPVINAVINIPTGDDLGNTNIEVRYTSSTPCNFCGVTMFDEFNNVVQTNVVSCGGNTTTFEVSDTCVKYKFIMSCSTRGECGTLISDTVYYDKCNVTHEVCTKPVITSVNIAANSVVNVYFNAPNACQNCLVTMFDQYNTPIQYSYPTCGAGIANFKALDSCFKYKFVVTCNTENCGVLASDTSFYNPCDIIINPDSNCTKPTISYVNATQYNHSFQVYFQTTPGCDSCKLYMYDQNGNQVGYNGNVCGLSSYTFTSPTYDSCAVYSFVLRCYKASCTRVLTSSTYFYNGCTNTDTCLVYQPIILPSYAVIPAFLNCGYVKPCITCNKLVNELTPAFRLLYQPYAAVPYLGDNITDEQMSQNALWARFINYRTGFSYNTLTYLQAYQQCNSSNMNTMTICSFDPPTNSPANLDTIPYNPCLQTQTAAQYAAQLIFNNLKDSLIANFDSLYKAKCLSVQATEVFYVEYLPKEYHYTLYYYDQAGNLVKTMPPAAVKPNYTATYLANVKAARNAGADFTHPDNNEALATQYRYNSLNQVVEQKTPDAGVSKFWYDRLGRLVVSQNAAQITQNKYSYTQYDALGRITQVGQKPQTNIMTQAISQNEVALQNWLDNKTTGGLKEQITRTVYDISYYAGDDALNTPSQSTLVQQNLRNRVSYTQIIDVEPADGLEVYVGEQAAATYYSYDIHGNVDTLVQDLKGSLGTYASHRFKKMVYDYDLISGKVNKVSYQPGFSDQFFHKYQYDAENRITHVYTSNDGVYWEQDAAYDYYRHGPLYQTILGKNEVQGLQYAYTIQGWLKGVNSSSVATSTTALNSGVDMGQDGIGNSTVARDAYGYNLHYFEGDYKPINTTTNPFVGIANGLPNAPSETLQVGKNLFNGNIRGMLVNIPALATTNGGAAALLYGYRYDQLNRIKAMNSYNGFNNNTNVFGNNNTPTYIDDYKERITYDPNGNIKSYLRNGAPSVGLPTDMDYLTYEYEPNKNQLRGVRDIGAIGNNYPDDIDHQSDQINYKYDAIGNLVQDKAEGIYDPNDYLKPMIEWTVYGKMSKLTKIKGGVTTVINYTYDASGNRISKLVNINGTLTKTFYVRDASGNVMSIYSVDASINSNALTQTEVSLYGSSRLGVWHINRNVSNLMAVNYSAFSSIFTRGNKLFELSNHLGNVLVTISDKKLGHDAGNGTNDYYSAEVVTANDYYPFGMQMPGRKYTNGSEYRYGFNGKENDKNAGEGIQDYGFRITDVRLGRLLSVDPLAKSYPWYSPYQFAGNDVLRCVDLLGLQPTSRVEKWLKKGVTLGGSNSIDVYDKVSGQRFTAYGVVDPYTNEKWIIAEDGQSQGKYFYLKNDNSSSDQISSYWFNGQNYLAKGHFERFETQNETDAKSGAAIADGFGYMAVGIVTAPAIAAAGSGGAAWVAGSGESGWTILSALMGDATAAYGTASAGVIAGTVGYAASGEATAVEGMLQNEANVVRGGTCNAIQFENGSGVTINSKGQINGASVNSANNLSIKELSSGIPNNKVGTTTVGDIRAAGGQVTPSPNDRNPNHATLSGITPQKAEALFKPTIDNPKK